MPDESKLESYIEKFHKCGMLYSIFREPDFGNIITSITVEPTERAHKLTAHLPLMLKTKIN